MTRRQFYSITTISLSVLLFLSACKGQPPPNTTVAQSQREVTYPGVGGVTLAGTLVIPAHQKGTRVPGVIIVAGSGPTDRNGNQLGGEFTTNLYSQLADQLAQQGIASLRYDKRAVGASSSFPRPQNPNQPTPAEIKALQDFFDWDNYVGDARDTLRELQQQPEIDPARTALIGHSEGSNIVGQVAAMDKGLVRPAALVLISGPGRPLDVILREQIAHQLEQQPTIPAGFVLSKLDEIFAGLRKTGMVPYAPFADLNANSKVPPQLTQNLEVLFQPAYDKLWYGELQVYPAAAVKHFPGPALVLQGAKDIQVFATEDTPLLDAALKSRTPDDHLIDIIPNTSHDMKLVQNPATDPGITGPVVPECTNTLRHWLAEKLSAGR